MLSEFSLYESWSKHSQLCAKWLPGVWVAYRLFARDLRPWVISSYYPIISAEDNRHAVIEISLTADQDEIDRAKARARVPAAITEGAVTPVVITSRLDQAQSAQAEAAGVTTFVMSYP